MGFSCRVIVNIENDVVKEGITVPLSAVVFDNTLNSTKVFVYNPSTQKVEQRKVNDKGPIVGRNDLIVTGDVKAGEQVVSAGASYLAVSYTHLPAKFAIITFFVYLISFHCRSILNFDC